jgi:hypothetical protein
MASPPSARAGFGQALRHWRQRAGLTQLQLAARLNYNHSFVSRLESDLRPPTPRLAEMLDQLLGAGGELAGLVPNANSGVVALPGSWRPGPCHAPILDGWKGRRLPLLGLQCPLHGTDDCAGTAEPEVSSAGLAEADDPGGTGQQDVHALVGLLRIYTMAYLESSMDGVVDAVEGRAHAVARKAQENRGGAQAILLHVAASYADLAGELRSFVGQHGQAMAWLQRGIQWGAAAGNTPAVGRMLGQMSMVARLEDDAGAAIDYARCLATLDSSRRWTVVHARLHTARAAAHRGDGHGFERHMGAAEELVRSFDDRDRAEAPWLCGPEGVTYFQSFLAGGLRDVAARELDAALARRAATCAQVALDHMPHYMHPSRVLLRLRLADTQARAGLIEQATATAAPVLPAALRCGHALVAHELRHLRSSLPQLVTGPDYGAV